MDEPAATDLRSWRSLREELGGPVHPDGPRRDTSTAVPTNVGTMLQTALGGPRVRVLGCIPTKWRVCVWCACWPIGGTTAGYTSLIFKNGTFSPAPIAWTTVGHVAAVLYTAVGVICAIATYEMAEIVGATVDEDELAGGGHKLSAGLLLESREPQSNGQENHDAPNGQEVEITVQENSSSRSFLRGLLQCEVSATASQVLVQQIKRAKQVSAFVAVIVACQATLNLSRPGRREHFDGTEGVHHGLVVAVVSFWIVFVPCVVVLNGWLIFLRAPCVIICDRIKYSAARVRQMTSETADYDAVMGYIHEAHELTVRLGVLLSPTLIGTCLMCTMVTLQWYFAACTVMFCETRHLNGWSDPATGQPLVVHIPLQVWFIAAMIVQQGPVWQMFAAASATTACDELVEAVADLRCRRQALAGEATIAREFDGQIASPDNLIRIQGLLHFAQDVNRGAGLGVSLKYCRPLCTRRPITVAFVWRMVFTVLGLMLIPIVVVGVLARQVSRTDHV
eukprot:COSAG02_NODE_179_length_31090_cov_49.813785_17_plen_507_part_00